LAERAHRKGATRQKLFQKQTKRFGFGFFFAVSLTLIIINTLNNPLLVSLRKETADLSAPLLETLTIPANYLRRFVNNLGDLADLRDQNKRLLEENERLKDWQRLAELLEVENSRMSEALNAKLVRPQTLVTARVISVVGGPFVRSVLVNTGSEEGVREGLAVVDQNGVVGQTVEVGRQATRVLLLTDFNSRIPVRLARSKDNGILRGRNEDLLDLDFLPVNSDLVAGDKVLTSGDGGLFPPGLLVGVIHSVGSRQVKVRPAAELKTLEFVLILDYSASEMEPAPQPPMEKEP
jgi:rod shape-determining protein MreC